jgi:four helix bundle protein
MMFKFEKLEVWKKSVVLYQKVSAVAEFINQREQFSLGEQIRRAALSISSNIAEGTGREGNREAKYFFNIAKGSIYEVVSLLYVMKEKRYLKAQEHEALYKQCDEIAKMLSGLLSK